VEGEGVAQIVRPQGREPASGIGQLGVVVAVDLLEDEAEIASH
jgi:hypothetical protein